MALQHKRSSVANKRPDPVGLSDGQLALNLNALSTGLFYRNASNALVKVGPVHVGSGAPNASPATGGATGNTVGEQWLDTTGGTYVLKTWNGSSWVELSVVKITGSTGSAVLPVGTEAERDGSPSSGFIRFNTDSSQFEGYNGTAWSSVGGGATGGGSDQWALEHDNTITASYTIGTGKNVISAGPLTVNSGAVITVPSGSNWTIV